jgi:CBS domain containing-hemolysin-like protein
MTFEWLLVGVGLLLTFGTGVFVAAEFSLVTLDRNELEARRDRGEKRLGPTIKALKITSTHLSSAQLGITLTTLLTGFTFEPAISSMLRGPLANAGVPGGLVPVVGSVVAIVIATLFSMVIGELVPKNFALAVPLATAKVVVPLQAAFTTLFKPVILLFNNTANAIIRMTGIEPKEELSGARTAEELSFLVRRSALEGVLDNNHADMLNRTLRFSEHSAGDVMTPRVRMISVSVRDTADTIVQLATATGFSRFPVIDKSTDDIVGVLHVKQAFAVDLANRAVVSAADLKVDALRVPESMGVDTLLGALRKQGFQIAIVADEYGGTAGIVTLEDLVEELVGELEDEHDRAKPGVIRSGRSVVFDASLRPDELFDRAAVTVPDDDDGDYDTVAGFMADRLDRIPELGDEVAIEGGVLRIDRVDGMRVQRVRYTPAEILASLDPDSPVASTRKVLIHE